MVERVFPHPASPMQRGDGHSPRPDAALVCDICGRPAFELHCKIICRNCGFTRDCTDP